MTDGLQTGARKDAEVQMAQVVMLTALAGENLDIVPGDICECSTEQANRFIAFGYGRELNGKADLERPLKYLEPVAKPASQPNSPPAKAPRRRGKPKDAPHGEGSQGEEADES